MANGNYGINFRLIHLILVLLAIFGSGVAAWVLQQAETESLANELDIVFHDGTVVCRQNKTQIAIIQYRLDAINAKQQEIATEQKAMRKESDVAFKEILKRLSR